MRRSPFDGEASSTGEAKGGWKGRVVTDKAGGLPQQYLTPIPTE
jgi:hypothetical protein